ncbi:MAG: RNA-binding protein, partial [Actinomycetota bacterium]
MSGEQKSADESLPEDTSALVEPVRQRLVTIAADVVGRLDTDDIPGPLRPVARFTPAKRVRLGATALSAALDSDDGFRDRVAQVVSDGSPQLAAAVRNGTSTAASDPIDTAVVAYLLRPSGWQQVISEATTRWSTERGHAADATHSAELTRLRAEVAELRTAQRQQAGRVRDTVSAA